MRTKILFVVLFVLAIAGCKSEAEKACQQGEEAFAEGQSDQAVAHYRKALEDQAGLRGSTRRSR